MLLYKSHSLCHICYRHIESEVIVEDNQRYIVKSCPEHGEFKILQDPDAEFCDKLEQKTNHVIQKVLMVETTDRCNLNCPHCYHLPKNNTEDLKLDTIYNDIKTSPKELKHIVLAGAEPTVRKDMFEILNFINKENRISHILTNGVLLSDKKFVEKLKEHETERVLIGLNHWDYQGKKVHEKQMLGISNCIELGQDIYYIGYTVENYYQLYDILKEINEFPNFKKNGQPHFHFRIRLGSNIGRSPLEPTAYISKNYKTIKKMAKILGYELLSGHSEGDDNMYHMFAYMNGHKIRIIQWPDAKNIDLHHLKHSPWAKFNRQNYISNFVHQVITRDAYVNDKMPVLDKLPKQYQYSIKNDGDIL